MIALRHALYLFLISPCATGASPLIDGDVKTEPIRVGSYNIAASKMGSLEDIASIIATMNADIVGLQEVDKLTQRSEENFRSTNPKRVDQVEYISELLEMNYYFCKASNRDDGEFGTAILSKHPLGLKDNFKLPKLENARHRSVCAVEVLVPNYPAPVLAITTHLDTEQEIRERQIRVLRREFSSWKTRDSLPVIIGDLNINRRSAEYESLVEIFNDTDEEGLLTAPSWNPDRKIDYILTSYAQKWDIVQFSVANARDETPSKKKYFEVSDHLPIVVEMRLVNQ